MEATSEAVKPQRATRRRVDGVAWLTDLVRLEIALWNRIDALLRDDPGITLATFETLDALGRSPDGHLRIGDAAHLLGITNGAMSKLADRTVALGFVDREPDPDDRRASRLVLTNMGTATLAVARATCETAMHQLLDASLPRAEQAALHQSVRCLLDHLGEPHAATERRTRP